MEKIDKEFCLTDNSVNVYGYRLLTEGLNLSRFAPSIGFLMHERDKGVAVRWEDFRIDGDKLWAKPVVNTTMFPNLVQQIKDGFYSAASVGHIMVISMTDDAEMKLPGQTGPTVTEWFPRECSIVDIPGNFSALSELYDQSDKKLYDLKSNPFIENKNMLTITLTQEQLKFFNLKAGATTEQITAGINDLVELAQRAEAAEKALSDLKAETRKNEIDRILEKGVNERRITVDLSAKFKKTFNGEPNALQDLIDSMPVQALYADGTTNNEVPAEYRGKTYQELYVSGALENLKAKYPKYYEELKKGNK